MTARRVAALITGLAAGGGGLVYLVHEPVIRPEPRCEAIRETAEAASRKVWNDASRTALLAGLAHVESRCRTNARSRAGAEGIAQIMPGTAGDIRRTARDLPGNGLTSDPTWSIHAAAWYLQWSATQLRPPVANACHRTMIALAAYNGGAGTTRTAQRRCAARADCNPSTWEGVRSQLRARETRRYPELVIRASHVYLGIGWPGHPLCTTRSATHG